MSDVITEAIKERFSQEYGATTAAKKNIKTRITELSKKSERLFDFYLDGKCDQVVYDKQKASIDSEMADLQEQLAILNQDTSKDIDIMMALFDVTANAKRIMAGSIIPEKRALLNLILSNAKLDGTILCFEFKKLSTNCFLRRVVNLGSDV